MASDALSHKISSRCAQADYPLPYWPGVILFHSVYALFEARRFSNFQKYKEVRDLAPRQED